MKKITLMLTLLFFSLLTFAQMQCAEKAKSNDDYNVKHYKSVKSIKVAGDVFWEEHFDSTRWAASVDAENLAIPASMPDGWTVYDRTGNNFFWHWSQQGPRGKWCSDNPLGALYPDSNKLLKSTTYEDGVMMLESAYFNTDASGEMVAAYIDMDCFIQSPVIDLSGTPGVILKFEQKFRYCCSSSYSRLDVWVSTDYDPTDSDIDNGHWDVYDVKQGTNANDYSLSNIVELDISSVAAGQQTVYIRWQQTLASHYQWQIDDVQLIEPMSNNIMIEKTWADYLSLPDETASGYDATYDWNGGYVDIPLDLVGDFVQFRAAVKNFGSATQTGVQLNTVITKDGENEVYNKLSNKVDIENFERDSLLITDVFRPTQKGHYQVSYTVTQDQTDEYMANNYNGSYFNITDSAFSRTSHAPSNYTSVSPQDWSDAADGDYLFNYYQIPEGSGNVTVSSATIYFSSDNDSATIVAGDMSVIFRLYGDADGDISETPIISSEIYTLKLADRGTFITLPFEKDGSETIEPGDYWVAIEAYTNYSEENAIRFKIGNDQSVPITKDGTYVHTGGSNYLTYDNAVIDLNIAPRIPSNDSTLSDLKIDGTTISGFASDVYSYDIELPSGTTQVPTVTATTTDANASAVITPAGSLPGTTNIVITAEDGTTKLTYSVSFTVVSQNSDATLSDLKIDGNTIASFTPAVSEYNVELAYGTTDIPTVTATTNVENANAVVTQATSLPGTANVVVTSEDGSTTLTYSIDFTIEPNDDAKLSDLKVDDATISEFSSDKYSYDMILPYGTTLVPTITVTINDDKANVVITPAGSLPGTTNVVVTAEDGTTQLTYSVSFTVFSQNFDATLSDLKIDGNTITGFNPAIYEYNVELAYGNTDVPVVTATTNVENANLVVTPADSLPGITKVVVTSQDISNQLTYSVSFTVASSNNDATLSDLKVDGTTISEFSSKKYSYYIRLPYGISEVPIITVTTSDENANAVVTPASGLPGPTNVAVTAEDGTTRLTYSIYFTVEPPNNDATLSDIKVNGFAITEFSPDVFNYYDTLPSGTIQVPDVEAIANDENANITTVPASEVTGTTSILILAEDKIIQLSYFVHFSVANNTNIKTLNENNIQINVFPNPCNDNLNVVLSNEKYQDVVIRLVNISGQVLYMKEIKNVKKFTENINVSEFAKGIYYLKVNAEGFSKIKEVAIGR